MGRRPQPHQNSGLVTVLKILTINLEVFPRTPFLYITRSAASRVKQLFRYIPYSTVVRTLFQLQVIFSPLKINFSKLFSVTKTCERGWTRDQNHEKLWFWSPRVFFIKKTCCTKFGRVYRTSYTTYILIVIGDIQQFIPYFVHF